MPARPDHANAQTTNLQIGGIALPAWNAGLQTGTRGAPRCAPRDPTRKQAAPASARSRPAEMAPPPRSAGLRPASRPSAKPALLAPRFSQPPRPAKDADPDSLSAGVGRRLAAA